MAFNKELWTADLASTLYADSDWFRFGKNWSEYLSGSIVTIPQGSAPTVPVGQVGLVPFTSTATTFGDKTFTNTPIFAPSRYVNATNYDEASFDVRQAMTAQISSELKQAVSQEVAFGWCPNVTATGSITDTTGTTTRLNIYGNTVKTLTFNDLLLAKANMVKNNPSVNVNDLYLIVDPFMESDLIAMGTAFNQTSVLTMGAVIDGFIGTIAGLKVISKALGNPYTAGKAAKAPVDYTLGYAATTLSAALIVEGNKVGYAYGTPTNGEISLQIQESSANIFKPTMQAYTRLGATTLYDANAGLAVPGVHAIIEAV